MADRDPIPVKERDLATVEKPKVERATGREEQDTRAHAPPTSRFVRLAKLSLLAPKALTLATVVAVGNPTDLAKSA